ncbi:class I SAM-dependent methyltransferase [Pseudomonas sp. UBA6562]|uniref:class I SAM-dependent methyltransferase n=1 Tax=Pseudomonas sp. UBA6562 TaxID=1947332 RepID=UPI0025FB3E8A|nr:class I SAM-dependent methyltransferase [Pseudomonas sp. UBA6562]
MNRAETLGINASAWDKRTQVHVDSEFYATEKVLSGTSSIQQLDLSLLGNLEGLKLLHLQCHFGLDTISLARMGADCTGIDISVAAIEKAKELSLKADTQVEFIVADAQRIDRAVAPASFDIVYTSYGVLCWIEDIREWARGISNALKKGGRLIVIEYHPFLNVIFPGCLTGTREYFHSPRGHRSHSNGTYTDRSSDIEYEEVRWAHSISEIHAALTTAQLSVTHLGEHGFSPYPIVPTLKKFDHNVWREEGEAEALPYLMSLCAQKT